MFKSSERIKSLPILVDFKRVFQKVVFHSFLLLNCLQTSDSAKLPLSQNVKWPHCFNTEMGNISSYSSTELQKPVHELIWTTTLSLWIPCKLVLSNSLLCRFFLYSTQNCSACIDCRRIYGWVGLNMLRVCSTHYWGCIMGKVIFFVFWLGWLKRYLEE